MHGPWRPYWQIALLVVAALSAALVVLAGKTGGVREAMTSEWVYGSYGPCDPETCTRSRDASCPTGGCDEQNRNVVALCKEASWGYGAYGECGAASCRKTRNAECTSDPAECQCDPLKEGALPDRTQECVQGDDCPYLGTWDAAGPPVCSHSCTGLREAPCVGPSTAGGAPAECDPATRPQPVCVPGIDCPPAGWCDPNNPTHREYDGCS